MPEGIMYELDGICVVFRFVSLSLFLPTYESLPHKYTVWTTWVQRVVKGLSHFWKEYK